MSLYNQIMQPNFIFIDTDTIVTVRITVYQVLKFRYANEHLVSDQSQETGPSDQSEQSSSQKGGV